VTLADYAAVVSHVDAGETATRAVEPAEKWSWVEFCRFLHETPAPDAHKITLLAVVVRSAGHPHRLIDVEEMMVLLERSRRTVVETLAALADGPSPWVRRGATMGSKGWPIVAWYTAKRVEG
jgi:hypothetical protein